MNENKPETKRKYAGSRIYAALVQLKAAIHDAEMEQVEIGVFAELDVNNLIDEARKLGSVPVWNAESTPIGKALTYPKGTTGVNQ